MTDVHTRADGSRDSRETASDAAQNLADEARESAEQLKNRAAAEARRHGDAAKSGAADEISNMESALRRAAGELRDGSPQERTFGQMADALADVSDTIRDKDFGEMANDLTSFARRNPLAFLGGAALLGFAGTRMLRASERNRHRSVDLAETFGSPAEDDEMEAEILRPNPVAPATPAGTATPAVDEGRTLTPATPAVATSGAIK